MHMVKADAVALHACKERPLAAGSFVQTPHAGKIAHFQPTRRNGRLTRDKY